MNIDKFVRVCVCVCVYAQSLNYVQLFGTPWTVACQGIPRQEYWNAPPRDLPNPGGHRVTNNYSSESQISK